MHLQFGTPGVREVLTSADGASLVQIQADRVAYNWRKIGAGDDYPRYDTVISPFEDLLERVFARCPTPSERTVTWVEVIYVNHVATAPQEDAHRFPERILSGLATQPTLKSLLVSEDFSLTRRFLFPNNAGRLYIEASSAIGATAGQKIMLLTLTARVSVTAVRSTREALDLGHDAIVRTFADITSPEYQEEWGRER